MTCSLTLRSPSLAPPSLSLHSGDHLSLWFSLVWLLLSATSMAVVLSFSRGVGKKLYFSNGFCLWCQHLSKQHWRSASVLCSGLFTSLQALISFSCLQFCVLFLLRCWPHTSSLVISSVICACSAVCWNSSPFIFPFHWKIFEECWRSFSLLVNDEVCSGEN